MPRRRRVEPGTGLPGLEPPDTLLRRYRPKDLHILEQDLGAGYLADVPPELFDEPADSGAWRQAARQFGWELLYRLEPGLYDRLVSAERLHPAIFDWLPAGIDTAVELATGTGRLTMELAKRCRRLVAVEPAYPMRQFLAGRIAESGAGNIELVEGLFDRIPMANDSASLVITCSSFTPHPAHGGDSGLEEMHRVAAPGGMIVIVRPADVPWLSERGFRYVRFPGRMKAVFSDASEAAEIAEIFFPQAAGEIASRGLCQVPYSLLGIRPPNDLAWKPVPGP